MNAGGLDRRVRFERPVHLDDGFSSAGSQTWVEIATVWAAVTAASDGERWRAGALGATVTHRIKVRFSSVLAGLSAKDRVVFEGRTMTIGAAKEIGRREWLEVTATEVAK